MDRSRLLPEHMALNEHQEGDIEIKFLGFEPNWYKRTTKEKIAIKRIKPKLNEDEGRYISPIFDSLPSKFNRGVVSNDVMSTKRLNIHGDARSNHHY